MSTTLTLQNLYQPVQPPLDDVKGSITQLWTDALELVGLDAGFTPTLGGKMLRPALCLMSAGALGAQDLKKFVPLATAFEALHLASLAHDDVIDRALLRRGTASLAGLWDNHAAVLGGDYLVARSVEILATYDSCPVIANAIKSVRQMAEGELFFFNREASTVTQDDCIMLAKRKTASLFAEAISAPTYVLGASFREALYNFGIGLGIAFQLVDDILDVTQPTERLGKPSCGDVVEGKQTLPIMFLREALSPEDQERLAAMKDADITDDDRNWIITQTHETGAREKTEAITKGYANDALENLDQLPDSPFKDSMRGIMEFILIRVS